MSRIFTLNLALAITMVGVVGFTYLKQPSEHTQSHLDQNSSDESEERGQNGVSGEIDRSILSIKEKIKALSTSQEHGDITTALLFEEIDKLNVALEAIARSNENIQEAVNASEQLTREEIEYIEKIQYEETVRNYEETLATEAADTQWASSAEQSILDIIDEASENIVMQSVECKTTLCKVTVQRAQEVSNEQAAESFDFTFSWPGEYSTTYDPNTGIGVAYLARGEQSLDDIGEKDLL